MNFRRNRNRRIATIEFDQSKRFKFVFFCGSVLFFLSCGEMLLSDENTIYSLQLNISDVHICIKCIYWKLEIKSLLTFY